MTKFNVAATALSRANDHLTLSRASITQDATAMIGSGQATAFSAGMSSLHKQDVMNSTLYAQLASNVKYDRFEQPKEWYSEYTSILSNIGWIVTEFQLTENILSNVSVSVDSVVLGFLQNHLNADQIKIVRRLAKALSDDTDPAATIFDGSGAKETNANFQMGICLPDSDGNIIFYIGAFAYTVEETITRPLFMTIKRGSATFENGELFRVFRASRIFTHIIYLPYAMTVNEQIYATIRDAVASALSNYMDLMKDIALPPL